MAPFQFLTLFLAIVVVVMQFRFMRQRRDKWLLTIPDLMWAGHTILFYVVVLFDPQRGVGTYTAWSSTLRLHGMLTLATMCFYRFLKEYRNNKKIGGLN